MKRIHTYSHGGKKAWEGVTWHAKDAPPHDTTARTRYDGLRLWWQLMRKGIPSQEARAMVRDQYGHAVS